MRSKVCYHYRSQAMIAGSPKIHTNFGSSWDGVWTYQHWLKVKYKSFQLNIHIGLLVLIVALYTISNILILKDRNICRWNYDSWYIGKLFNTIVCCVWACVCKTLCSDCAATTHASPEMPKSDTFIQSRFSDLLRFLFLEFINDFYL